MTSNGIFSRFSAWRFLSGRERRDYPKLCTTINACTNDYKCSAPLYAAPHSTAQLINENICILITNTGKMLILIILRYTTRREWDGEIRHMSLISDKLCRCMYKYLQTRIQKKKFLSIISFSRVEMVPSGVFVKKRLKFYHQRIGVVHVWPHQSASWFCAGEWFDIKCSIGRAMDVRWVPRVDSDETLSGQNRNLTQWWMPSVVLCLDFNIS